MQVIQPIRVEDAAGSTRRLLESVTASHGALPNMILTMAQSPLTLEGYLKFSRALAAGSLTPELREQIALTVAQANHCDYSLASHSARAGRLGLSTDEIRAARESRARDPRSAAALRFAHDLTTRAGGHSTEELRRAGFDDAEIVEIVAHAALNTFENLLNTVAQTALDAPLESPQMAAA